MKSHGAKESDPFRKVHRLFRIIQKKNKFVSRDIGGEFSIQQSFLLLEIDARKEVTAIELADIVELDKSTVSRHLSALEEGGWISSRPSPYDARAKLLSITQAGKSFLEEYDRISNQILKAYIRGFSAKDEDEFCSFFRLIADGFGTSKGLLRKHDHPIRVEMRRLTRSLGILKPRFMGSGLNVLQWQVLSELYWNENVESAVELSEILSTHPASMSAVVRQLRDAGYISFVTPLRDRRYNELILTDRGRAIVEKVEETAAERLKTVLSVCSTPQLAHFLDLLQRFVGLDPALEVETLSQGYIRPLRSEKMRKKGRTFLITHNEPGALPEILVGYDSINFGLFFTESLAAVAEFRKDRDCIMMWNFSADSSVSRPLREEFFKGAARAALQKSECRLIFIPDASDAIDLVDKSSGKKEEEGIVLSERKLR